MPCTDLNGRCWVMLDYVHTYRPSRPYRKLWACGKIHLGVVGALDDIIVAEVASVSSFPPGIQVVAPEIVLSPIERVTGPLCRSGLGRGYPCHGTL